MNSMIMFWIIVCLSSVIVELLTPAFFALSLAFGSIFALIATLLGFSLTVQLVFFIIAIVLFFIFLRPLLYHGDKKREHFGSNALIGSHVIAEEEITQRSGSVKINGTVWQARCKSGTIDKGENLIIRNFDNIKVVVEKENIHG